MFALKTSKGRGTAIAATTALLAAGLVGFTGSAAQAAASSYVISPAVAPTSATAQAISITGSGFRSVAGASNVLGTSLAAATTAGVQLATACGTNLLTVSGSIQAASVGVTSVSIASATKMSVYVKSVPLATGSVKLAYKLCVYGASSGNPLLGSATYTVYPTPQVTTVAPASGPNYGGGTVTLVGTDFTKTSTVVVSASAGTFAAGIPATNVKVVDATTITFTMPAAVAGAANVYVANEGGSSTADTYTFVNTATVSPATASNAATAAGNVVIQVRGSGFNALTFNTASGVPSTHPGAQVIFMRGDYAYSSADGTAGNDATVLEPDQVALATEFGGYCTNVVVESDTSLSCTAPTLLAGVHRVEVISNGAGDAVVTPTTDSSGSTFTVSNF